MRLTEESLYGRTSFIPSIAAGLLERCFLSIRSRAKGGLRSVLAQNITVVPDARLASSVAELRAFVEQPFASMEIGALIRHSVHASG